MIRVEANFIYVGFEQYSETTRSSSKYACQAGWRYGYLAGSLYDMDKPQSSEHVVAVHFAINTLVVRTFFAIDLYFFFHWTYCWLINNMDIECVMLFLSIQPSRHRT